MDFCGMGACSLGDPISVRCRARPATKTLFETVARAASEDLPSCRNSKDSHRRTEMWREVQLLAANRRFASGITAACWRYGRQPEKCGEIYRSEAVMERSLGKTILVQAEPQADEIARQRQKLETPI